MLTRISIPDTPERNESINIEQVNFSQSNQIADTQPDPITTTETTITDLIQLHANQALLLNQEQMIQEQPQLQEQMIQEQTQLQEQMIQEQPQRQNETVITITNLNTEQTIQEQPQFQHESTENPITAAETTITNLIQLHVNQAQISNQEQNRVQNNPVNLVQVQADQSNKSKIQITRNFVPDPGAQTSKTADKRPKEFQQPLAKRQNLNHPIQNQSKQPNQNQSKHPKQPKQNQSKQPKQNQPKPNQSKRPKQNQRYRDISPTPKERNKTNGLKLLTPVDLPINPETHFIIEDFSDLINKDDPVNPTIIEELFEEFTVIQPNPEEQAAAYEIYRQKKLNEHNHIQPTQQDIEKARAEGYVLGADWKTQFTIKAFKGCRRVKDSVKQVAVEYSNGDIQWIDKDILKLGEAQDSLRRYLHQLNILSAANRKINKRGITLK